MQKPCVCPKYEEAFTLLGKRWNGLLIRVLFSGPFRFKDINDKIPLISEKVLSDRLKELEEKKIINRTVTLEVPIKIQYELTEKGESLRPVLDEVQKWADDWI
ncbi:winged helix-turn-helix transcriptional regulator [Bacillus sp. 2205SS5-2]|uniref:winged helix-turn-helix transcriptional regulator n=1 Tax=Bacillus sp. 2205SS5-2 TaxID=3109031 RepID=UPI0030077872